MEQDRLGAAEHHHGPGPFERHLLLPAVREGRPARRSPTGRSCTGSERRQGSTCRTRWADIVPTNQWKEVAMGQPMYTGEILQAGIGQGYDAVTPLQLLNAYCALANGGNLWQPTRGPVHHGPGRYRHDHQPDPDPQDPGVATDSGNDPPGNAGGRNQPPYLQHGRPPDHGRRQDRYRRVRHTRQERATAVPRVVRRVHARQRTRPAASTAPTPSWPWSPSSTAPTPGVTCPRKS